jgi:hypothetical protein
MNPLKKSELIQLSVFSCVIAFMLPFFFKNCQDTYLSVISVSLAAVGTVATLWTLVIAVYLYDRFGLESKFIEKQTEKVLELTDLLKGKTIVVRATDFHYFIRPSRQQLHGFNSFKNYQNDKKKKALISPDDYDKSLRDIIAIKRSYWLPEEIKVKMEFLKVAALLKFEDSTYDNYVRLDFQAVEDNNWMHPIPEMTFESFNNGLHDLVLTIENWLSKHSGIELNLKLEEPNQFITNQPDNDHNAGKK